jgi:hypothetical protein
MANPEWCEDEEQEQCFAPDQDNLLDDAYDNCIGAKLTLQKGDELATASVKRRKLDEFGKAVGTSNPNQILDTRLHAIEFADGAEAECSACCDSVIRGLDHLSHEGPTASEKGMLCFS